MRIVYLNPVGALGGAERSLLDMIASVREADPTVSLHLLVCADGPLIEHAESLGVDVTLLPMPPSLAELGDSRLKDFCRLRLIQELAVRGTRAAVEGWLYAQRLRRIIRTLQPDIVHSNGMKTHLLTGLTSHSRQPVIWHMRDFLSPRPLMSRALRWASAISPGVIGISDAVGNDVRSVLPNLRTTVIHNAIDTAHFLPGPSDGPMLDRMAGLPSAESGTIRIGILATYARWKGQDVFLQAAAILANQHGLPPLRFYIIGGPIYHTHGSQFSETELRTRMQELGIAHCVGLIGFQQDTRDCFRSLDVVVHASTQPEPFGRTIIEAMACGKAVIVSRGGGATELFTEQHDAVSFARGDHLGLAKAMSLLATDSDLRNQLAANARQTALVRFSRQRLGEQLLVFYRDQAGIPIDDNSSSLDNAKQSGRRAA